MFALPSPTVVIHLLVISNPFTNAAPPAPLAGLSLLDAATLGAALLL